jgi:hypothetical protein
VSSNQVLYQRNQIPQNSSLNNTDDGSALVAPKLGVVAGHDNDNAPAADNTSRFVLGNVDRRSSMPHPSVEGATEDAENCLHQVHYAQESAEIRPWLQLFQKFLRLGSTILWYFDTDPFAKKSVHALVQGRKLPLDEKLNSGICE